jgi:outer membrane receptor protein involved in Fe transport
MKLAHLLFLFVLLCTLSLNAQTTKSAKSVATLMGNVQEATTGKPILGATITLKLQALDTTTKIAQVTSSNTTNNTSPNTSLTTSPSTTSSTSPNKSSNPSPNTNINSDITDKNGAFNFEQIPFGYYRLTINALGFARYQVDSIWLRAEKDEVVLNDIQLKDSTNNLSEVVVYADKKLIEDKDGVLTYNVSESPISNGSNASDILKNMPLVNANPDGTLTVKGKAPLILIDDKPTNLNAQQLTDLLESLPANVIEKVELMQNPPPEYATHDGSVINIVSKKGRIGFSQRYALTAGSRGETSLSSNVNYKSQKLSFNGNVGIGTARSYGNSWSHRKNIYTDSVNYFYNTSDYLNKNWHPNLRLQVDYDIDKRHSWGVVYQGNTNYLNNVSNTQYTNLDSNFRVWKASTRQVDYIGSSYSHGMNASYLWKGVNPVEKLQLFSGINFGKNQNGKDFFQQYLLQDFLPSGLDSSQNQQSDTYTTSYYIRANYNKPFDSAGKKIITTGFSFTQSDDHNILNTNYLNKLDSTYHENSLLSNDFFFYQSIFTARLGGIFLLPSGWRLIFGAQAEYTAAAFKFLKGNTVDANNDYWRVLPNATIRRDFTPQLNMSLVYRQAIRRPGIRELNPSIDYTDPYNIRFGNPYVKPALTHNWDYSISYNTKGLNINGGLGYSKVKDVFSAVRTLVSTGKTQTTYTNIADQDEMHASLWSGITISPKLKFNMSTGYNYNRYSEVDKILFKYRDGGSYYVGLNYSYMPDNLTMLEASNKYSSFANPQGKARSNINMTISGQRKFLNKKLVVNITAVDPLGLTKYTGYTEGRNFVVNTYSVSNTRNFRLTVSYQLNKTYTKKKPGAPSAADVNKASRNLDNKAPKPPVFQ